MLVAFTKCITRYSELLTLLYVYVKTLFTLCKSINFIDTNIHYFVLKFIRKT